MLNRFLVVALSCGIVSLAISVTHLSADPARGEGCFGGCGPDNFNCNSPSTGDCPGCLIAPGSCGSGITRGTGNASHGSTGGTGNAVLSSITCVENVPCNGPDQIVGECTVVIFFGATCNPQSPNMKLCNRCSVGTPVQVSGMADCQVQSCSEE